MGWTSSVPSTVTWTGNTATSKSWSASGGAVKVWHLPSAVTVDTDGGQDFQYIFSDHHTMLMTETDPWFMTVSALSEGKP